MAEITAEALLRYAQRQRLRVPETEIAPELAHVEAAMAIVERLDRVAAPTITSPNADRDAGRPPSPEEDPYNAIIRFCDVRGTRDGPLAGMRVGVKDNIAVAGVPLSGGKRHAEPFVPTEDAVVVERLLDAGAAD